jgi:3-deoxy-D-manno-octulosonic acid kinase
MQERTDYMMGGFPYSKILVNEDVLHTIPDYLFDPRKLPADKEEQNSGRGTVFVFQHHGHDLVLKTYHRGGMPGRFIKESYLYTGVEKTRMWREFHLLRKLHAMGLPVPRPIAARCELLTPFIYRGQLIMEKVAGSNTLAELISEDTLDDDTWKRIGEVIAEFHNQGLCHSDLNASNILLSEDERIYLIDFDKCELRKNQDSGLCRWTGANLKRLLRSLKKFSAQAESFHFSQHNWQKLKDGYFLKRLMLWKDPFAAFAVLEILTTVIDYA